MAVYIGIEISRFSIKNLDRRSVGPQFDVPNHLVDVGISGIASGRERAMSISKMHIFLQYTQCKNYTSKENRDEI